MTTFRQFTQPLFAGLAAFALSLAMMAGTVATPHAAAPAATPMEYVA